MSTINESIQHNRSAAPKAGIAPPVMISHRVESKVESSGTKGSFFVTILISGIVLVSIIVLGSRIAKRVQNVQDGFTSSADAPAVDTKPTPSQANQR